MKTRSNALYQYLLAADALHCPDDALREHKRQYRRLYKRNWKRQRKPYKELRFAVTLAEHEDMRRAAAGHDLRPTAFAKRAVLAAIGRPLTPDPRLLRILQLVSMAVMAMSADSHAGRSYQLIQKAEALLLSYLKQTTL